MSSAIASNPLVFLAESCSNGSTCFVLVELAFSGIPMFHGELNSSVVHAITFADMFKYLLVVKCFG